MEETIQFEPERRKGSQPARFGMGISTIGGRTARRRMTPSELASWKLNQALMKYPEFTKEGRQIFQDEFVDMPGLRTMNMKVLAATLSFLNSIKDREISPDDFKDENILPYIRQLLPVGTESEEKKRLIVRFKAQILIYIRAIKIFRSVEYE